MLRFGKIVITPGFWVTLAASLLLGASRVLPLVALAALLHELGHLLALGAFSVRVDEIRLTAFGAQIRADTQYLSYGRDILCTLAGPGANLLTALVLSRVAEDYLLAGANLLQGSFNLLVLPGLDGARALRLILCRFLGPERAERIGWGVELSCALLLLAAVLNMVVRHGSGGFLLVAMVGVFISIWREICVK